ncbi:MAG: FAD-dependent oxidoreductase [Thermoanaerobaculia bacterium]
MPLLLDWDGVLADTFSFALGLANVLVFDTDGTLAERHAGPPPTDGRVGALVDRLLDGTRTSQRDTMNVLGPRMTAAPGRRRGAGPAAWPARCCSPRPGGRDGGRAARPGVGGRTSTFQGGGFTFDLGPTFFLYPQVLRSIFAMCGRSLDRRGGAPAPDPHYRLVFEGSGSSRSRPIWTGCVARSLASRPPTPLGSRELHGGQPPQARRLQAGARVPVLRLERPAAP